MKGLGHAVLMGQTLIGDQPFGMVLMIPVYQSHGPGVLEQMAKLYKQFRCTIVAVEEVPEDEVHKYGVIAGQAISDDLIRVETMVEKPSREEAPSNLAIIGRYILTLFRLD